MNVPVPAPKPLSTTMIVLDNVSALLVELHERRARGHSFIKVSDVERLLATGRLT